MTITGDGPPSVGRLFERAAEVTSTYFVVWILLGSGLALYSPSTFTPLGDHISLMLGVIMLGMGLTLTVEDFRRVLERPRDVFICAMAQWLFMPLFAYLLVALLGLSWELGIGLLLLGAAPGGTASNVMTYLGRGDVALSVTITSVTTIAAPLVVPAWIVLLAGEEITVTFAAMAEEIVLIVLIPVTAGLFLRILLDRYAPTVAKAGLTVFPAISVLAIVMIVAAIVGLNVEEIFAASALVFLAVIIHNALGLGGGLRRRPPDRDGRRPSACLRVRGRPAEQRAGGRTRRRLLRSARRAHPGTVQRLAQRDGAGAGDGVHPDGRRPSGGARSGFDCGLMRRPR